jgi:hypothetical protein
MEFIKNKIIETRGGYASKTGLKAGKKNNHERNSCFKNYSKVREVENIIPY